MLFPFTLGSIRIARRVIEQEAKSEKEKKLTICSILKVILRTAHHGGNLLKIEAYNIK